MSWPMVEALHREGLLDDPLPWMNLLIAEDVIFGMLARALGFELRDLSAPGEPFGVQSMGLAYAPEELAARGYGLIHSTRKDARWREREIRRYFGDRRAAAAA